MEKWIGLQINAIMKEEHIKDIDDVRSLLDDYDLNNCDKCGRVFSTYNLNWITAEDFELKIGEELAEETYKKYDCLCENCLRDLLIKDVLTEIVKEKLKI